MPTFRNAVERIIWDTLGEDVVTLLARVRAVMPSNMLKAGNVGGTLPMATIPDHHALHENGGSQEISVAGLSGLLADPQTPAVHVHAHGDLTGVSANQHHNQQHSLTGSDHILLGLVPGTVLTATSPTDAAFVAPAAALEPLCDGILPTPGFVFDEFGDIIMVEA